MKKKNLKLTFNKETIAKLQMDNVKGGLNPTNNIYAICITDYKNYVMYPRPENYTAHPCKMYPPCAVVAITIPGPVGG